MKNTFSIEKNKYWITFALISVLFIITRLFRLASVPFSATGMHFDEISAAYDAWCIQGWGVDRHLIRFPVYFMNTGPGQNALYIYLAAIMFKLFGFSLFKFRLVAVICAAIAYIALFYLSRRLFGNTILSLVPNALMTVMPVFLMSEHWGLESYLFLSFSVISFSVMIFAIDSGKTWHFGASGLLWGLTLYTYGISYIVVPVFLVLTLGYLIITKKVRFSQAAALAVPLILLGIPLALEQLVIAGIIEPFSFGITDFLPMDRSRAGEISIRNIPENLITSFWTLFVKDYMFYNSDVKFGTIFYISIPFMILGIAVAFIKSFRAVKDGEYSIYPLIIFYYISGRSVALMTRMLNINKANELYFPYLLFTSIGIIAVCEKVNKKWVLFVTASVYLLFFVFFAGWAYSNRDDSWNGMTRPRYEENLIEDIHSGLAVKEAQETAGDRPIQLIINDIENRYLHICLFSGTSPYYFSAGDYAGDDFQAGVPSEIDTSGNTVYVIEDVLHHITDYLVEQGFVNQVAEHGGFSIVYKPE